MKKLAFTAFLALAFAFTFQAQESSGILESERPLEELYLTGAVQKKR